jgi:hypothetical protein
MTAKPPLTGLERVRRAVHFQNPDRIPHFLPDGGPNDIEWLWLPRPKTGLASDWHPLEDGRRWQYTDEWGNIFQRFGPSGSGEVIRPVLDSWERLDEILTLLSTPPSDESIAAARREIDLDGGAHYQLAVLQYPSLFATCHYLRGLTTFLTDLLEYPTEVGRLLDLLADSQILCIDLLASAGAHGMMGYDDWGIQDRPLISPRLWRKLFAPRYRRVWQHAHARGLDVWLHSCGQISPLLDDMLDCGLNVIQMDQQENMGVETLGQKFGGRLAFWCPVDIQGTMVTGGPQDVDRCVHRMVYHLGSPNGGFISKYYPSPEDVHHAPENTAAMCTAFRRWGVYPIPAFSSI